MVKQQKRITVSMRHLGGRQQGIQSDHAGTEYVLKYYDTPEWQRWARKDKTIILLEAFTSDQLQKAYDDLRALKHPVAKFHEPDFGNAITSICFLVDESTSHEVHKIKNQFPLASG
jgi:hypothetical protein